MSRKKNIRGIRKFEAGDEKRMNGRMGEWENGRIGVGSAGVHRKDARDAKS